jgi:hypothetical protein
VDQLHLFALILSFGVLVILAILLKSGLKAAGLPSIVGFIVLGGLNRQLKKATLVLAGIRFCSDLFVQQCRHKTERLEGDRIATVPKTANSCWI